MRLIDFAQIQEQNWQTAGIFRFVETLRIPDKEVYRINFNFFSLDLFGSR